MRGTRSHVIGFFRTIGIIPAHAGNTIMASYWVCEPRDHPRACGEHYVSPTVKVLTSGSSPRMRGTHSSLDAYGVAQGIIPAHAGNTGGAARAPRARWDHPRACGEHPWGRLTSGIATGSSPRMRGTLGTGNHIQLGMGIIPAHAGNTYTRNHRNVSSRDHPRACGEHL